MAHRCEIDGILTRDSGSTTTLDLKPWRYRNADWKTTMIRVDVPVAAAKVAPGGWRKGSILRLWIGDPLKGSANSTFAVYARGRGPVRRLPASAGPPRGKLATPKAITDRALGTLRPEQAFEWYASWRTRGGAEYEVSIAVADLGDRAACEVEVAAGSKQIVAAERRLPELRRAIAAKLVPIYNRSWRAGGPQITAAALLRELEVESIGVGTSGRTTVLFGCGELFTDHAIEVRISPRGKLGEILLAG